MQYDHNIVNILRNITNNNIIEGTGGDFDPNTFSQEIKSWAEKVIELPFAKDVSGYSFPSNENGNVILHSIMHGITQLYRTRTTRISVTYT